jgi:hypothetical protein
VVTLYSYIASSQLVPLKCWYPATRLHCVTTQTIQPKLAQHIQDVAVGVSSTITKKQDPHNTDYIISKLCYSTPKPHTMNNSAFQLMIIFLMK